MATVPLSQLVGLPIIAADQDANAPQPNWPYGSSGSVGSGSTGTTTGGTSGTWTSLPIPVGSGGTATGSTIPTTSTGNGNITTSTGNASGTYSTTTSGAIAQLANTLGTVTIMKTQTVIKDKILIKIQKVDGSQLILQEQDVVTPQEMVGLSKFFMLMGCVNTVYASAGSGYNIKINWSELIKTLSIERHFVAPLSTAGVSATNVLDITLFDPT